MTAKRTLLLVFLVAAGGGGLWWSQTSELEAEPEAQTQEGDTGFSRQETEDRMRAIGYVR